MVNRGPAPGRGSSISRPSQQSVQFQQSQQPTIETPAAVAGSSGSSGWGGGGMTLAEKLKQAEMQKLLPPPVPVVQISPVQEEVIVEEFPVMASSSSTIAAAVIAVVSDDEVEERHMVEVAVISDDGLEKEEVETLVSEDVQELVEQVIELSVQETIEETNIEIPMTLPTPQPAPVGMSHATPMSPVREIMPIATQVAQELQDSAPKAFLKMGKWEAPSETSAFQFGSFGNYSNPINEDTNSISEAWNGASVTESAESQKKAQAEVSSAVWGASGSNSNGSDLSAANSSSGPSPMSSLFPVPKGLPSVTDNSSGISSSSNSQYNQQKPSAPPGLEQPHTHSSMSKALPRQDSRSAVPVQNRKPESAQKKSEELQYQQPQQYQQPAGIPIPAGRGMPPITMPLMPYGYPAGFDLQSQQYLQQQQQSPYGQPAPVVPPPAAASSPTPATGAPAAQQGQQQGQGAAPGAPQVIPWPISWELIS
jgi:hypothetical protein